MEKTFLINQLEMTEHIWKYWKNIATVQGDDYRTGCLINYPYFKNNYKLIAIDLSKQQVLDSDPKATQQINFTGNLDWVGNTTIFYIYEEDKKTVLNFSQRTVKVLQSYNHRCILV